MINSPERVGAMCDALQERLSLTDTENEQLNTLLTRIPGGGTQFARLEGFVFGVATSRAVTGEDASAILADSLKAAYDLIRVRSKPEQRPGRDHTFSVDVMTERGQVFLFDVPSMNASDAYFQLSKRSSYKSIADICRVMVFEGTGADRTGNQEPVRSFERNELIFTGLP